MQTAWPKLASRLLSFLSDSITFKRRLKTLLFPEFARFLCVAVALRSCGSAMCYMFLVLRNVIFPPRVLWRHVATTASRLYMHRLTPLLLSVGYILPQTTAGITNRRVLCARGAGGRVCSVPLLCFVYAFSAIGNENYTRNKWHSKFIFLTAFSMLVISNPKSFSVLFDKTASVSSCFIWKIYFYFSIGNGTSTVPVVSAYFSSL